MRYTGIQPQYFPRLHYFARILATDTFMIRDDCQFVRSHKYPDGKNGPSYQAHSPIKSAQGTYLLTVNVKHEGLTELRKTRVSYQEKWVSSHLGILQSSYGRSINFKSLYPEIRSILKENYDNLADLNTATIMWGILHLLEENSITPDKLNISYVNGKLSKPHGFRLKQIKLATSLESYQKFNKMSANEKILAIMKEVGATEDYCGGTAMAAYVNESLFDRRKIKITVQDWKCQKYKQMFDDKAGFIPNLSIVDLLMNVPHEEAVKIING